MHNDNKCNNNSNRFDRDKYVQLFIETVMRSTNTSPKEKDNMVRSVQKIMSDDTLGNKLKLKNVNNLLKDLIISKKLFRR